MGPLSTTAQHSCHPLQIFSILSTVLLVETIEGFAGVVVPKDSVVGEGGEEGVLWEGSWENGFAWGLGEAAGEGVAAANSCCHFFKKNIECITAVVVKTAMVA